MGTFSFVFKDLCQREGGTRTSGWQKLGTDGETTAIFCDCRSTYTPRKRQRKTFVTFSSILIDLMPQAVNRMVKQSESSLHRSSATTHVQHVFW